MATERKTVQIMLLNKETGAEEAIADPITQATNCDYVDNEPVVNTIGGVSAGKVYGTTNVQQVLYDLLHPYVKPTVSLAANPGTGVREKGVSLTDIALTASVTKKSSNITKVEFFKSGTSIGQITSPKASGGTETYTYAGPITSDCNLSAKVTDSDNGTVESSKINYTFVYPIYIGLLDASLASAGPAEADVTALSKRIVTASTQAYTSNEAGKCYCIACPPGMTLSAILDPNKFDSTSAFQTKTMSITGLDGTAQTYTVYWSGAVSQVDYTMTFQKK